ncbi:MAG: hypothetical protein AAGJ37_17095 [Pseudomonadota bacterium]
MIERFSFATRSPEDYKTFFRESPIGDIQDFKNQALQAFDEKFIECYLEPDSKSRNETSALKIMVITDGGSTTKHYHIGHVGEEKSKFIVMNDLTDKVIPRIVNVFIGDSGYVDARYDIIGPKDSYHLVK